MKKVIVVTVVLIAIVVSYIVFDTFKEENNEVYLKDMEPDKNITLNIFYSGDNISFQTVVEEVCKEFMAENPDIKIMTEQSGYGDYTESLKVKEATGNFPDIFEVKDLNMLLEFNKLGEIPKEISSGIDNVIKINDKVYSIPFYDTSFGIIYNKVLFKKFNLSIPKNYDEFLEICEVFEQNGISPLAIGGSKSENITYWMNYFFLTNVEGAKENWQQNKKEGTVSFEDDDMLKALSNYQNLMNSKYILKESIDMNDNQIIVNLLKQNVAMYLTEPSMFSNIFDLYPNSADSDKTNTGEEIENDTVKFRMGWFYMPDQYGNSIVVKKNGVQWGISESCNADSEKKEAIYRFLNFCYEEDTYRQALKTMYAFPTTKGAILYPAPLVQQELIKAYRYSDKIETYLGDYNTSESFKKNFEDVLYKLASNNITVEQAAKILDENFQ